MLYNNLGKYNEAITNLNEAIKLRPREPSTYLNRGLAYFNLGQYDKALADYNVVLKLEPRNGPAYNNRCMLRAIIGKDLPGATADCNDALKLQPNDPYTYDNFGLIALKEGDWSKAITAYSDSLKVDPQRARALYGMGIARAKSGDKTAGGADMAKATGIQPNIAEEFSRYGIQ